MLRFLSLRCVTKGRMEAMENAAMHVQKDGFVQMLANSCNKIACLLANAYNQVCVSWRMCVCVG